jgi:hypothetical protein
LTEAIWLGGGLKASVVRLSPPGYATNDTKWSFYLCGVINRRSDLGQTTSDVFIAIRQDMSAALKELWSTLKDTFMSLYRTATIVKVIEVFFIGSVLSCVPELLQFLLKTMSKVANV